MLKRHFKWVFVESFLIYRLVFRQIDRLLEMLSRSSALLLGTMCPFLFQVYGSTDRNNKSCLPIDMEQCARQG